MGRDQSGQLRQRVDAVVGLDPEFVHLGPDRLEHRQRGDQIAVGAGLRHRLRSHPLDPGDVEAERLGAAGVPGI
jgi:hypothetical protein